MGFEEFMEWGRMHHYPQLVLDASNGEVLRYGADSWWDLAGSTHERIERAIARVELFEARLAAERERARVLPFEKRSA